DPSVKQPFRYESKASTSAPKKGATNVGNASKSSSMLKTAGTSSKKDNIMMSNSYSALNDEEDCFVSLQTCLTEILGFLEKFGGGFKQDIDEQDKEKKRIREDAEE
ncbi:hypothetical protein Tco_0261764, partial [Tanacetum coccineum]